MAYIRYIWISLFTLVGGVLLFLVHNNWILIVPKPQARVHVPQKTYKTLSFYYPTDTELTKERHTVLWPTSIDDALFQVISEWLTCMHQEQKIAKKIVLESVALNTEKTDLYISLDGSMLNKHHSAYTKWLTIEALLRTIHEHFPTLQRCMILVNQAPITDPHIDFSAPLPLEGYVDTQPERQLVPVYRTKYPQVVIDPASSVGAKGRTIDDTFERPLALHTAQRLKDTLGNMSDATIRIVHHSAHSAIDATAYTNKPQTTLVVALHIYEHALQLPHCAIYYYMRDPQHDFWKHKKTPLLLLPCADAYRAASNESYTYAHALHKLLLESPLLTTRVFGMPYKSLMTSVNPAIALEIGIKKQDDLDTIIPHIAQALSALLSIARVS